MPKIFICYRREDSKWPAQRIYDKVVECFGSKSVVWDIDTIPLGADFREYLNKEVSKCGVLLAIIGDKWLDILKQRIDEPKDYVRIEIESALEKEIPVWPILVGKNQMPSEKDLPPKLADLSHRQAAEVHAGPDLQNQLERLVNELYRLFPESKVRRHIKQKQIDNELMQRYLNSLKPNPFKKRPTPEEKRIEKARDRDLTKEQKEKWRKYGL